MSHHPQYRAKMPYTPHFQPSYRYPIALAHSPRAGDPCWPGPLAPAIQRSASTHRPQPQPQAQPQPAKAVRFAVPSRSRTLPAGGFRAGNDASASSSRRAGHVSAAPMLAHSPHGHAPIHFNLEYDPQYARLAGSSVALSAAQRNSLATSAPLGVMRLRADGVPWAVDVAEQGGIRVEAVLQAIAQTFRRRVRSEEYSRFDERTRRKLDDAYRARVARAGSNSRAVAQDGILRVDWLQGKTMVLGIAPTSEPNTWSLMLGYP
ncbi:hypothetical protein AURDEDRAFT_152134 [Auricularia subglabra TFB-10046 SS5]|nr:hypothetical protein AURDEDRAFT_152134 [Auricularia subglabra TFB-10046 SS5]